MKRISRRELAQLALPAVASIGALAASRPRAALAMGEEGAFHPRLLDLGEPRSEPDSETAESLRAASRWAFELVRRTSAPGRVAALAVRPSRLLEEPFVVWAGSKRPAPLEGSVVRRLREYLRLGGIVFVDDRSAGGEFLRGAEEELLRVLPESAATAVPRAHVVYKSFYLLDGPAGRKGGSNELRGIVRGKSLQVLFCQNDLLGALGRTVDGSGWQYPIEPDAVVQRELAIRFAVNVAMYALCSDYKDDQVHAPFLMRRRGGP